MSLTSRQLFDLSVLFNSLYDRAHAFGHAERLARLSNVNVSSLIVTNLPPRKIWELFLQLADGQGKVLQVVNNVMQEPQNAENRMLLVWQIELTQGVSRRLDLLAGVLKLGQCVLFLGPGMLQYRLNTQPTRPFSQVLAEQLADEIDGKVYFDPNARANLNYIVQRYLEKPNVLLEDLGRRAKLFYEKGLHEGRIDQDLHQLLANLPFRMIINTNPDNLLAEHINRLTPGRCAQRYYSVANDPEQRIMFTERPNEEIVHYNIFGSFCNPSSVLFTESHLLDFTKRILRRNPPIDPTVMREFDDNKSYLFLGFDFDQWNMKIVFDMVLQLVKKTDRAFSIFPSSVSIGTFNREFFEKEFQMYFIEEDLKVFLTALNNSYQNLANQ